MKDSNPEQDRLSENATKEIPLEKWGPYLSEREWGTVREDYSGNGDAWNYFPHDHARSRVYLWGEDGLAGISDYFQNLCFAIGLWNGKDPILKERLFGLTNGEGNHGEDVKELYYYLDNVPSHYYMKYLYKYPQAAYPYEELIEKNKLRTKDEPEYELLDTGVFDNNEYFDVYVEYAKKNSEDILIKIEIVNRGSLPATVTVLPTLWFYNRWQYGGLKLKPVIELLDNNTVKTTHERMDNYHFTFQSADDILFTENETNTERLFGTPLVSPFVKDAFHEAIISGTNIDAIRNKKSGTKFSPVYHLTINGGGSEKIYLRLSKESNDPLSGDDFENLFASRKAEADEFYQAITGKSKDEELHLVQRQAFAGLLWSRQYYHLDIERWLNRSDGITPVTNSRRNGRNHEWKYLKNQDVISMPDKWEYPWYAAWDTAFHCISMAIIDPLFAKNQLLLLMREWYMNPEGQLPAYEWNFGDVNPPVHAFAALQVYEIEKEMTGVADVHFLKRIFQKLIINFTWWANRKDENGNNIFEGGFLGLDNIGIFNRSAKLPGEIVLEQADGTSWMGMYALNMMDIALELAVADQAFEDAAIKFYEHFVLIAEALNEMGLWNEEDQFFYDVLSLDCSPPFALRVRTIVGLTPLFAISTIDKEKLEKLQDFKKRKKWIKEYRINNRLYLPDEQKSDDEITLLSLVHKERLIKLLERLLDESEFLSQNGIRSVSKYYGKHPYSISVGGIEHSIQYDPGDSTSDLYGGNSNWRGPIWMPVNYLFIKALQKYGNFYADNLTVEFPRGSGKCLTLSEAAMELSKRIIDLFKKNSEGERKFYGSYCWFYQREENKDLILFHEYFHGDTGRGLGASHQTGWTALVADLIKNTR